MNREDQQKVKSKEDTASRLKEEYELKFSLLQREKEESERLYREEADFCIKEALTDVRYDEEKQRELRRTLEGETADLRAMLVAMEQASNDMETRHAQSMQELTKVINVRFIVLFYHYITVINFQPMVKCLA